MTLPDSHAQEEQTLIEAAIHSDMEAFTTLYRRYVSSVYTYITYRVGNLEDSEELVSQTFMKVVEYLPTFEWRHHLSFKAWLFRLAYTIVCDYYRHKKGRRHQLEQTVIPLQDLPEIQASDYLPDDILLRKESFAQLRELIGTLSPAQQEVITLHFYAGLRLKEICQVLGLPRGAVDSHLRRGLESLRKKLAGQAFEHA